MTWQDWLSLATARLQGVDNPQGEARSLLAWVTGKRRSVVFAFGERRLTAEQQRRLADVLARRERGEPMAYLTGEREFWSLPLCVSAATLIPRPDSECLVEEALRRLPVRPCQLLDLGTGSGALALAIAHERRDCQVLALDKVPQALALARRNVRRLKLANVQVRESDWFSALAGSGRRFQMIVSNPPYLADDDPHLQQGDVRFEPRSALVAADQGLADLLMLVDQARDFLSPGGWLLLEHGWQQGQAVRERFCQAGYQQVAGRRDYAGHERVSGGCWGERVNEE